MSWQFISRGRGEAAAHQTNEFEITCPPGAVLSFEVHAFAPVAGNSGWSRLSNQLALPVVLGGLEAGAAGVRASPVRR